MTVLLVDDLAPMRALMRSALQGVSADFIEAADGAGAIAAYTLYQPDWVVIDIQMPVMNGITATRNIVSKSPAARVVVVTLYDTEAMRTEASAAGAHAFLSKDELLSLPDVLLEGDGDARAAIDASQADQ